MERTETRNKNKVENHEKLQDIMQSMPLTADTACGFWLFKGTFFQRYANETAYVIFYGIVGCVLTMTRSYFNGTITTLERRYKIPSRNTGILSIGDFIPEMLSSAILGYYAGRSHRPRWIGFGVMTMVIACLLTAIPHIIYGPGEDALAVTEEYGMAFDRNATFDELEREATKILCKDSAQAAECTKNDGSWTPQVIIFVAQLIFGIGGTLYYTLGVTYMDDNTKKSKSPQMLSISVALSLLGPALGYLVVSLCLRVFISPMLTETITNKDPRWLGAWWLGWLIFAGCLSITGLFLAMFPKEMPLTKARRLLSEQQQLLESPIADKSIIAATTTTTTLPQTSFRDMIKTFRRFLNNKVLMYNTFATLFYFFGYTPYWYFTPKYIEIQFRQSAVTSSMVTGPIPLGFSILGVLLSGFLMSKYKPSARFLAAWNILVDLLTALGMLTYIAIGCAQSEHSMAANIQQSDLSSSCIAACNCDYARYSPVCGDDNLTYLSPCHAGCRNQSIGLDGSKLFTDCSCISQPSNLTTLPSLDIAVKDVGGTAVDGSCPVDCYAQLVVFLCVMCALKFIGSSGRATNMLIMVRCVPPEDKSACMGFAMMIIALFTLIPGPILFGWLLDSLCLVWGKTCTTKGNCLLYDAVAMRYYLHTTAAAFVFVGTLFNLGVWYYIKDIKIFDEEKIVATEMVSLKKVADDN